MHDPKIGSTFSGELAMEPIRREMVNNREYGGLTGFHECSLLFESNAMRTNLAHSEASARDALEGLLSQEGGRLPMLRAIHEAAADVEKSLKFWKKIVKKIPSQHRISREFLNR